RGVHARTSEPCERVCLAPDEPTGQHAPTASPTWLATHAPDALTGPLQGHDFDPSRRTSRQDAENDVAPRLSGTPKPTPAIDPSLLGIRRTGPRGSHGREHDRRTTGRHGVPSPVPGPVSHRDHAPRRPV